MCTLKNAAHASAGAVFAFTGVRVWLIYGWRAEGEAEGGGEQYSEIASSVVVCNEM
jgi:hypothetical protein